QKFMGVNKVEILTNTLLEAVFTVVGILVAAAVSYLLPKIKRWLHILADKDNLGIIDSIVDKAVEYAEQELQGKEGKEKFNAAATRVALLLNRYGIDASDELISSSVQQGWRRMNDKQK